jgi:hypothetical protein
VHHYNFDVDALLEAQNSQQDIDMVDDYNLINGADREGDGTFGMWYKREFYADGRRTVERDRQLELAKEIGAIAANVADEPLRHALASIVELRRVSDQLEQELVAYARSVGWSWRAIADVLGVTVSTTHRRFARIEPTERRRPSG